MNKRVAVKRRPWSFSLPHAYSLQITGTTSDWRDRWLTTVCYV